MKDIYKLSNFVRLITCQALCLHRYIPRKDVISLSNNIINFLKKEYNGNLQFVISKIANSLFIRYNDFLDKTYFENIYNKKITIEIFYTKYLNNNLTSTGTNSRSYFRYLLYNSFLKYSSKYNLSIETIKEWCYVIEKSAYNNVINNCEDNKNQYVKSWKSNVFKKLYNSRCMSIVTNIDKNSIVLSENKNANCSIIEKIINKTLSLEDIGNMNERELYSEKTDDITKIINIRSKIEINEKTSKIYKCPSCGERNHTLKVRQRKALDEEATNECICKNCGTEFKGT